MKRVQIGSHVVGHNPLIVGVVTSVGALARVARRKTRPFDMVEVRLDLMRADVEEVMSPIRRIEASGTPVLLTIRSRREKGAWKGTEQERVRLYTELLPVVSAVDMEIRSPMYTALCRKAHRAGRVVVGSYHDFKGTPSLSVLKSMVRLARVGGADITKIATMAKKAGDRETLFELLGESGGGPLCVIGMGRNAAELRVRLACKGSCLAYGFIDRSAAPGQMACRDLARCLRSCGVRSAAPHR